MVLAGDPETFRIVAILSGGFDANNAAAALGESIRNKKSLKPEHLRVAEAVGNHTLLIGTREAVDSAKLGKGLAGSRELAGAYGAVVKTGAFYALAGVPKTMKENAPVPQLQSLVSISAAVAIATGLDITGSARFDSAENAAAAKTMIDGFVPMLSQQLPPELLATLAFAVKGSELQVTVGFTEAQFGGDNRPLTEQGLSGAREVFRSILGWLTAP